MTVFRFDGTFEGLMTAVFESFRLQTVPDRIEGAVPAVPDLFEETVEIATDAGSAKRVWKKICAKGSHETAVRLYMVFLSGLPEAPGLIYRYICHMMASPHAVDTDFTHPAVRAVADIHRKVARETHRVHMFARFQQTAENTFYASVAPRYDVLPLATAHFRDRFAEAEWVIYDLKRNYGIYH
jgi:probable DNA metabolism protein